jgi:hypothetical protein
LGNYNRHYLEFRLGNVFFIKVFKMREFSYYLKHSLFYISLMFYSVIARAADTTSISGVDDMLKSGQEITKVAAKWGGIITVVGAALALGSGRLEGALAQTICKVLIVVGLLIAAMTFFGNKISWGFSF